ncbi:MAG: hypothetical protein ABIH85_04570 [Candidatus Omnitrophota bacterium]|nr:hypothetical protein [Candidatus Omnitrophota bacterium]MBU1894438.1 hypothetical protein [Candidatus Omnitrophota bacterium]
MRHFIKKFCAVLLIVSFSFNVSGCVKPYLIHPEFKERHKQIFSAAVMAPETDAYMLMFNGDQKRMTDLVPMMEKNTIKKIQDALKEKGYTLKELDLTEKVLKKNPELRTALFDVRKVFNKSLNDIAKRKNKKFIYSIGSEVNIFADRADADILIFVKEVGIKKSAGEIAKEVAKEVMITAACALLGVVHVPIPNVCSTMLTIAVVDSNDGAILWYIDNKCNTAYDPENEKHLTLLTKSLIRHFPDSVNKVEKRKIDLKQKAKLSEKNVLVQSTEIMPAKVTPTAM